MAANTGGSKTPPGGASPPPPPPAAPRAAPQSSPRSKSPVILPITPPTPPGRPAPRPSRNFRNLAATQEDEETYDFRKEREKIETIKFTSLFGSVAHIVKGALGGGILSGHVAYMKGGIGVAIPLNIFFGIYMGYCLHLLVQSSQVLYRRARMPAMSYADVGEAAFMMFPNSKVQFFARPYRYMIDCTICMDLFGSCCCYQIIIAKSIKQLIEDNQLSQFHPTIEGYPNLRVYLAIMIPMVILICLIRHLKYLAPFSIAANAVIVVCIGTSVYYMFKLNPRFENLKTYRSLSGIMEYCGMSVFSMSCSGVVIPIEANMDRPDLFPFALLAGMTSIVVCLFLVSFSGYVAFLEECDAPITINFPMVAFPKILKGLIALMIYVTHGLNFWVPFNLCFYYLKRLHPPQHIVKWELIYRAIFVTIIGIVAIVFPDINSIMGFIGCFCLSNMSFIWPNVITLAVIWHRPGLGVMKWRLWRGVILIGIGLFIFFCGSMVNGMELAQVFIKMNVNTS
ncbi:hypothetical protein PYW07_010829 [Mythimna separata]|uniref:Amino acid transporter transmembrane domain-containing protein n=1 Tax=Mythimna separata TaxID=271217 RepID=A0AAD8DL63_MYTSE|nr:hypothetical protein PYW07_010829 [Mythimna separata]